jgi:hypothetical protein
MLRPRLRRIHLMLTVACILLVLPMWLIDSDAIRTVLVLAVAIPYLAASIYLGRRIRSP